MKKLEDQYIQLQIQNLFLTTNEAKYYKLKFLQKFGISRETIIPNYWQPKWDKDGK